MGRHRHITSTFSEESLSDKFGLKTFRVVFKTLGMTFCAGEYKALSIDGGKYNATNLLQLRRIRKLESAEIQDENGKPVAMLRMQMYPADYQWITVRS